MCYNEDCPQPTAKTFLCGKCKNASFCSKSCQQLCWSYHKKSCIDPKTTAFNLMKVVYDDDFGTMNKELEASYGFEKCKTMDQKVNLLGLYIGLIKHIECDINVIDRAFRENKLPELIVTEFFNNSSPKSCGDYFRWFLQDLDICRH
ncbi:hypothetical protein BGZ46_008777 [Entomortierella lignicola]|nr:hypothetical protein BGZ46_008777 [Entomortierella lignicola]